MASQEPILPSIADSSKVIFNQADQRLQKTSEKIALGQGPLSDRVRDLVLAPREAEIGSVLLKTHIRQSGALFDILS